MKIGSFINREKIEEQNHREQKIPENKEKDTQKKHRKKTDDRWTERDRILMMHR